ncbi:MAG: hypothetical protein N2511_02835 [Thermodesulfovibrionales bacterium]|nr:hypothetical protein [Thermodesulfovibrionales bacterium]
MLKEESLKQIWGIDRTKFMIPVVEWIYLVLVFNWYTKKTVGLGVFLRGRTAEWEEALEKAITGKGNAHTERVMRTIKEELIWFNEFCSFEKAKERIGEHPSCHQSQKKIKSVYHRRSFLVFNKWVQKFQGRDAFFASLP